jgi:hypothetical protein
MDVSIELACLVRAVGHAWLQATAPLMKIEGRLKITQPRCFIHQIPTYKKPGNDKNTSYLLQGLLKLALM